MSYRLQFTVHSFFIAASTARHGRRRQGDQQQHPGRKAQYPSTMAPSAESGIASPKPPASSFDYDDPSSDPNHPQRKTVAFAVNYEPSMVDRYWHTTSYGGKQVKIVTASSSSSTGGDSTSSTMSDKRTTHNNIVRRTSIENNAPNSMGMKNNSTRRSSREQKQRPVNMTTTRVRYDMELVPLVEKNPQFLDSVVSWPPKNASKKNKLRAASSTSDGGFSKSSVLWKPTKRKDWEDSVSELTAVCTSAALRRHTPSKPFVAPLSREYIRDRIDIDDPLNGWQIRHQRGGWLQGYVLWTNFTTWTHYFTWDSLHKQSGISSTCFPKDSDGSLAKELNALPRSGIPSDSGVIFENIAELALLGGLGCGELLLRTALQDIRKRPQYKYLVLQATNGSRSFYERFGFRRVGAVCRYGSSITTKGMQSHSLVVPTLETPIQGYRHWTHANESRKSLDLHGGPSYMMCLKLPEGEDFSNLLEAMEKISVQKKPTIEASGAAATPAPSKRKLKKNGLSNQDLFPGLPSFSAGGLQPASLAALSPQANSAKPKRVYEQQLDGSANKRRKMDLHIPPPQGQPLSYAQKQYQSVWLAVPPQEKTANRRAPKSRSPGSKSMSKPSSPQKTIKSSTILPNTPTQQQVQPSSKVQTINRSTLCKQKVKSYPRDRLHFYNKVVRKRGSSGKFYFVLHYNERFQQITICPMSPKGTLSGKRQGRLRFQCQLLDTSKNWLHASAREYEPVSAFMVMKTPIVAQEAWDILG